MKLLHCTACLDVFSLDYQRKSCQCGRVYGEYQRDGVHAVYGGETAVPLGIANTSLHDAMRTRDNALAALRDPARKGEMVDDTSTDQWQIVAFVVNPGSDTFTKDD